MKKIRKDQDRPANDAEQTATDERDGKAVRGHENIDEDGHDQGHGDTEDERDPQNGL